LRHSVTVAASFRMPRAPNPAAAHGPRCPRFHLSGSNIRNSSLAKTTYVSCRDWRAHPRPKSRLQPQKRENHMSKEDDNKIIIGRWFTSFWGKTCNLDIVDELAAPDMLLQYSLHAPRRGREDIKTFMTGFRNAFPDLNFWGVADLIAEGDYVVGRWEGGGTHTGPAFNDFLIGALPPATGRKMRFTGTTVLRVQDGRITEEVGLDDGVTALSQLELIRPVVWPA